MRKRKRFGDDNDSSLSLYLREIGQTPLISPDEEVELAKRIHQGDQEALEKLTKANLRFVVSVAKQYQYQGLPLADLIEEGNLGLIEAAMRYERRKGVRFISYAVWRIRQAILAALTENSRTVRLPTNRVRELHKIIETSSLLNQRYGQEPDPSEIAKEIKLSEQEVIDILNISRYPLFLDDPFGDSGDERIIDVLEDKSQLPDEKIISDSLREEVCQMIETLEPKAAQIICFLFGITHPQFNPQGEKLVMRKIGQKWKCTRQMIWEIKEKTLKCLKIRAKSLKVYLT